MENTLNKIIKYSLYSLVFLVPIFFLPFTNFPVAQNKQTLLAGFCFFIIILWAVKVFSSGKISFIWNKITFAVFLLLLALGISTFLSGSKIQSFWGMNFEPDTLFSFILYGLTFFLFTNLFKEEKEILKVISIFILSAGISALLFLINSFFQIFPWDFAKTSNFNPVGSAQGLSLFLTGAFIALIALLPQLRKEYKSLIFFSLALLVGLLLFANILFINYWLSWVGIIIAAVLIVWVRLKNNISELTQGNFKNFIIPLIFLAIALIFILVKSPLPNILNIPSEVSPTYGATFDIAKGTLMEGPKNFILGSGPATFGSDFALYRYVSLNLTSFWSVKFPQGIAALPTFLGTCGVLGILAMLFMIAIFFWKGFKKLISMNQPKSALISVTFIISFYFFILWFFYPLNLTLAFSAFLMMGIWVALVYSEQKKEFVFSQSPQKSFLMMIGLCLLIVGSVAGIYFVCQQYAGALYYVRGVSADNLDEGITNINRAINADKNKDIYFRTLSQVFLLKTNEILDDKNLSEDQKKDLFQQTVSAAEASATNAVGINQKDSLNWQQLASVYENLVPFNVKGADNLAISNYQKAQTLDPQNPQFPYFLGRTYFAMNQLDEAKKQLEKSIELKADFSPATELLKQISAD